MKASDWLSPLVVAHAVRPFIIGSSNDSYFAYAVLWILRLVLFLLIARAYIAPYLLSRFSNHIRARSISLRSIRGLYFRKGVRTWRVDRIRAFYTAPTDGNARRIVIRFEGVHLQIGKKLPPSPAPPKHKRRLTLADLSPSPAASHLWWLVSRIYFILDPLFRPIIRSAVVSCSRHVIRYIPTLTQALQFEFTSTVITFDALPDIRITLDETTLSTHVAFTKMQDAIVIEDRKILATQLSPPKTLTMASLKSRLTQSFKRTWSRTWERTWGKTKGAVSFSLKVTKIMGSTHVSAPSDGSPVFESFFSLPEDILLKGSVVFTPKEATLDAHTLEASLGIGDVHIDLDKACLYLTLLKGTDYKADPPFPPLLSSPANSGSSLMGALKSASTRKKSSVSSATRAKDKRANLWITSLLKFEVSLSAVTLTTGTDIDSYNAVVRDVHLDGGLSQSIHNKLHREWLGRTPLDNDVTQDVYGVNFALHEICVERSSMEPRSVLRLLSAGPVEFHALLSHWPSPWVERTQMISGDPNAALVVVQLQIEKIEITERMDVLQRFIASRKVKEAPTDIRPSFPSVLSPMPRFVCSVEVGYMHGRLICADFPGNEEPFSLELITDGFFLNTKSFFTSRSLKSLRRDPSSALTDELPLRIDIDVSAMIMPISLRVRSSRHHSRRRFSGIHPKSSVDGDAIITVQGFEMIGTGTALGVVNDDDKACAVRLDTQSFLLDLHCTSDTIFVELWHPLVLTASRALILAFVSSNDGEADSSLPEHSYQNGPPSPISLSFSLSRLAVFVTGADINPDNKKSVTRGLAFRTGLSLQYCSVRPRQIEALQGLNVRAETRHKLYLPQERIAEAVSHVKASSVNRDVFAFGRVSFWNSALRSANANGYVTDDPHIAEKDVSLFPSREFLKVPRTRLDIKLWLKGTKSVKSDRGDALEARLDVGHIEAVFDLDHIYSTLLAGHTVQSLLHMPKPATKETNSLSIDFRGITKTIHIRCNLEKQKVIARLDAVDMSFNTDRRIDVSWDVFKLLVHLPLVQRQEHCIDEAIADSGWTELGYLHDWTISHSLLQPGPFNIAVEADSLRLRIPYGYKFSDLIGEVSVTAKCLRHLVRMASAGRYQLFPNPHAESARSMPDISMSLRSLCIEAADDPFESKLGLIWCTGLEAAKARLLRENADRNKAKRNDDPETSSSNPQSTVKASSDKTSSISTSEDEDREQLLLVHTADWLLRYRENKRRQAHEEQELSEQILGRQSRGYTTVADVVKVVPLDHTPPLFRILFDNLKLNLAPPSFANSDLPDFLYAQGQGLPRDTTFSLLIPMHVRFSLSSLRMSMRDYPLPLIDIPALNDGTKTPVLHFDSNLVIAEEMGTSQSVHWIDCRVVDSHDGVHIMEPLIVKVPKTIMPVKTYADPDIRVITDGITAFSWGISYSAATQDMMQVFDTLTTPPRDSSPKLGFWDKLRLIFHWKIKLSFLSEVRLCMKGTRDPYLLTDKGAGFALSWKGAPKIFVNCGNEDQELIQVMSNAMSIIIPKFPIRVQKAEGLSRHSSRRKYLLHGHLKSCAKFSSGVRFGIRFVLERSCGPECSSCVGTALARKCRFFSFKPHYDVKLAMQPQPPTLNGINDSYRGFRSDFIHLSLSLTSNIWPTPGESNHSTGSFHLTPKGFSHFWSWLSLFNGVLSLPIRQGTLYPRRVVSPKFGRHLATVKYRVVIPQLMICHSYIDESRDSWADGVTSFIGMKAMVEQFQVDLHQRDQQSIISGDVPGSVKKVRHKAFYAAEVVLKGLDLRAMVAVFKEPMKQVIPISPPKLRDNYRTRHCSSSFTSPSLPWFDADDFVEIDWSSSDTPDFFLVPAMSCPRITYFKRHIGASTRRVEHSKFGYEDTHSCLLGTEPSVPQVQIGIASERVNELQAILKLFGEKDGEEKTKNEFQYSLKNMITLLKSYIAHLEDVDTSSRATNSPSLQSYYMPSDTVSADDWADFEHVYQIHSPTLFLNIAIRDIFIQYYYCSRARRGFEYHLATRAVKFIKDQASALLASDAATNAEKSKGPVQSAQAAAVALRRIFTGDSSDISIGVTDAPASCSSPTNVDPLCGWADGVSLRKAHFCLLLKPQVILRSDTNEDSVCVLAALQAKIQSFAIMDNSHLEDPISGKIMTRNYASLDGLQAFSPTNSSYSGQGSVPLEVLIDFRCESKDFDRIVPQADATFRYDKFNRLRSRNNITSVVRPTAQKSDDGEHSHLHHETDLIQVCVPRFAVTATDQHFQAISNIVQNLVLFSDVAHKNRLEQLEELLSIYDFTDLIASANAVADLQSRLRNAMEIHREAEEQVDTTDGETGLDILRFKGHIFLLAEELGLVFDAIKLAQDRTEDHIDQKSALLLHASSSELQWRMLDQQRELLAKLAVRKIDYTWLSRQDSSVVNKLTVADLQAFDGSPNAVWAEILSKHDDPVNHPLMKRGLFLVSDWTVLPTTGNKTTYEEFQLDLHPIRLQLDARLGSRIMEYLLPARKSKNKANEEKRNTEPLSRPKLVEKMSASGSQISFRSSLDASSLQQKSHVQLDSNRLAPPTLRKLGSSRSFTDLRSTALESLKTHGMSRSSSGHRSMTRPADLVHETKKSRRIISRHTTNDRKASDVGQTKARSPQKVFNLVKVSSLYLLLSIMKAESFECRNARIRTRELEYRHLTFEELVDLFTPSAMTWRGWVKMAFHQPLIPVFPVARELFSKTKLIASKSSSHLDVPSSPHGGLSRAKGKKDQHSRSLRSRTASPRRRARIAPDTEFPPSITSSPPTDEPESMVEQDELSATNSPHTSADASSSRSKIQHRSRSRMLSLFSRHTLRHKSRTEYTPSRNSTNTTSSSSKDAADSDSRRSDVSLQSAPR